MGAPVTRCPQSDSNRHCADFKSAASANWAMGARRTRQQKPYLSRPAAPTPLEVWCSTPYRNYGEHRPLQGRQRRLTWVSPRPSAPVAAPAVAMSAKPACIAATSETGAESNSRQPPAIAHPADRHRGVGQGIDSAIPSRMSCSLTTSSSIPARSLIAAASSWTTIAPPPITSTLPACIGPSAARCARVIPIS